MITSHRCYNLSNGSRICHRNAILKYLQLSSRLLASAQNSENTLAPVIGLEIHAQLHCASKLFSDAPSGSSAHFSPRGAKLDSTYLSSSLSHPALAASNSLVGLFDMATPGTLPSLNHRSVQQCLRAAALLNCQVPAWCRFDRKHYFYPDMPSGYQITQKDHPIAEDGYLDYFVYPSITPFSPLASMARRKNTNSTSVVEELLSYRIARCRIERLQLETDSGKLLKLETGNDRDVDLELIDLNRAGVALVEIVTRPELHSAREAACFVEQLRELLHFNGVCEAEMHKGHFRVDANVSVLVDGQPGARTEIKNINSFHFLHGAIEAEIRRQRRILRSGGTLTEETRNLNTNTLETSTIREKGDGLDYRFTPEPNLPRLQLLPAWVDEATVTVTRQLPHVDYVKRFHFPPSFALHVARDDRLRHFIDLCLVDLGGMRFAKFYEWLIEFKRICEDNSKSFPLANDATTRAFRDTIRLEHEGRLTRAICFDLLKAYTKSPNASVEKDIERENLWRIREPKEIETCIDKTLEAQPELLAKALANDGPKLANKHFNRLRNEVVVRSRKRVDVADVEEMLFRRLKNKKLE